MDYQYDDLNWEVGPDGDETRRKALVQLKEGDSAPNPASTTRRIYGPCTVVYNEDSMGLDALLI